MTKRSKRRYGQVTGVLSPFFEGRRLRKLSRHVPPGADILDVGCGRGRILDIAFSPGRYVGVDVIPEVIEENRRLAHPGEFLVLDVEKDDLPEGAGPFDVIIMGAVIEHFRNPAKVLARLGKYLGENGRVILTTPSPRGRLLMKIGSWTGLLSQEAEAEHDRLFAKADIETISAESGFYMVHFETFLFGLNQLAVLSPIH